MRANELLRIQFRFKRPNTLPQQVLLAAGVQTHVIIGSFNPPDLTHLLLQLRVLRFRLLQYRGAGVGVFPEREEVFVRSQGTDPGGVGICTVRGFRQQCVRPRYSQTR